MRWTLVFVGLAASVALSGDAFAFQIETPITYGCHEKITVEARRAADYPDNDAAPRPTEDQRRTAGDLTFTLPADEGDLWTMTLLIGLRSNDIADYQLIDPSALVNIHDDPNGQPAHCLRSSQDDGPDGDATALQACREFILGELATGGFFSDEVDRASTEDVPLYLAFRHKVTVALPRFAYRLGRAVHALEDGYAHVLRNPTTGQVRHVTNWIDFSKTDSYDVARDGYQHLSTIDDCLRNTDVERYHVTYARTAVTEFLNALREPAVDGAERMARVEAVLDQAFAREEGCTSENRYCMAPELDELGGGCSATDHGAGFPIALVIALGCAVRRRRRAVAAGVLVVALTTAAAADTPEPSRPCPVWHGDFRFGAALDQAALAFVGGVGVDIRLWTVGLAVEWNPWMSLDTSRAREGALNVYATLARRWFDDDRFTLYSRAELGTSTVLFDLVGVDKYDTGVYFGGSLLGVALKRHHGVRMTLDPSHFAMPVPRPTGLPFYWRQYRISIGFEIQLP